jgi:hypothetical protein
MHLRFLIEMQAENQATLTPHHREVIIMWFWRIRQVPSAAEIDCFHQRTNLNDAITAAVGGSSLQTLKKLSHALMELGLYVASATAVGARRKLDT